MAQDDKFLEQMAERKVAREPDQPPPLHEEPVQAPQPLQELVVRVDRAWEDIGALISRADQLETTVRRLDRQTIMMVGTLALALWTVRKALVKIEEATATGDLGGA
jgi:hypothetical protein